MIIYEYHIQLQEILGTSISSRDSSACPSVCPFNAINGNWRLDESVGYQTVFTRPANLDLSFHYGRSKPIILPISVCMAPRTWWTAFLPMILRLSMNLSTAFSMMVFDLVLMSLVTARASSNNSAASFSSPILDLRREIARETSSIFAITSLLMYCWKG